MTKEEFRELAKNIPFEALVNLDERVRALEAAAAEPAPEPAPAE